jgi:hypothetical protein
VAGFNRRAIISYPQNQPDHHEIAFSTFRDPHLQPDFLAETISKFSDLSIFTFSESGQLTFDHPEGDGRILPVGPFSIPVGAIKRSLH